MTEMRKDDWNEHHYLLEWLDEGYRARTDVGYLTDSELLQYVEEIKAANRGWETKVKVTPLGNSRRRTKPAGETHYSQTYEEDTI